MFVNLRSIALQENTPSNSSSSRKRTFKQMSASRGHTADLHGAMTDCLKVWAERCSYSSDEDAHFGNYVATVLRKLDWSSKAMVKLRIQEALTRAEVQAHNGHTISLSSSSSSLSAGDILQQAHASMLSDNFSLCNSETM